MPSRIHIFGASGSGTTSLASAIAAKHGHCHLDTDDFYWLPTAPPYQAARPPEVRLALLRSALAEPPSWVLSGSLCGGIPMNQDDVEIRPARAEDARAITECVTAAYRHYIARIGKPPGPMLDDYTAVIQQHRVLVLTTGGKISGVLVLIAQPQSLLVDNVAVHPDSQGRGFGRQLMTLAEEEARRVGFTAVTLYTHERMTENIELYKKLGYRETARKTEQGYQRVYMRKALPAETSEPPPPA